MDVIIEELLSIATTMYGTVGCWQCRIIGSLWKMVIAPIAVMMTMSK